MTDAMPDYPPVVAGIIIVDCADPQRLAEFWGALLGRNVMDAEGSFVGLEWAPRFGAGLSFQRVSEPKVGKNRVHFDLICSDIPGTEQRVIELGGKRAAGYPDDPKVVVMQDPEDNEFCLVTFG